MRGPLAAPWRRRRRPAPGALVPAAPAAPDTPSTPSPADTATAYFTLLSWVSARATKFDIYLDTVNPPTTIVVPQYNTTSYVPTLAAGRTYYWKIVAFNDGGSATGPVWSFTTPSATSVHIALSGVIVSSTALRTSLTIHDILGSEPNNATLRFATSPPGVGSSARIGLGTLDDEDLLFAGELQDVYQTYLLTPERSTVYPATFIDHSFRLNRRRPFGTWTNVSASTIARHLVAIFASGFTANHVQDGLPAVSINFDGSQDFMACMRALATAISDETNKGKTKVDYAKDVWLYLTYALEAPDPIDNIHPSLNDPSPIRFSTDLSQIRTVVYGKGHGESVPTDVALHETILPLTDAVMFNTAGGQAIASTTADGAQTQILTYTGVQRGGGGSLVGPGQSPSTAPTVALLTGTELGAGTYKYAYSDVTAAGESLPSPLATIVTGVIAAPGAAATLGSVIAGGSIDLGTHDYEVTFVTSLGETTPSPVSTSATTLLQTAPSATLTSTANAALSNTDVAIGDLVFYTYTYLTSTGGETTAGSTSNTVTVVNNGSGQAGYISTVNFPAHSLTPWAAKMRVYRNRNGSYGKYIEFSPASGGPEGPSSGLADTGGWTGVGSPPGVSTAAFQTISSIIVPTGDVNVTNRKLYRRFNGTGTFKLVTTLAAFGNFTDTIANASLGADAPSSNTATGRRVAVSAIAIGASGTTSRNVWRTAVDASQLKFLTNIAGNVTQTFTDATPDSSLGTNAPTGDTSGFAIPSGQVLAGSTSLLTASAGPFDAGLGGWVILSGGQTVRYTGIAGNTLTGIPASGPGSITTTVLYGSQVLPAPTLIGINSSNGISVAMAKGSSVNIWVKREDLAAQAELGLLELDDAGQPTDGIHESMIVDERSTEARMIALCDADLAIFSRPIVGAEYYTRDPKTKAGRTVSINLNVGLSPWGQSGDFTIQSVEITVDSPRINPLYHVTATSVSFTLTDLLRRVALVS